MTSYERHARQLLDTLAKTEVAIDKLHDGLDRQLSALRERHSDELQTSTDDVNDATAELGSLLDAKKRQACLVSTALDIENTQGNLNDILERLDELDLPSDALAGARARIQSRMTRTNRLYEDLAFALSYSAMLDHDMLLAVFGYQTAADTGTYSAAGSTEQPAKGGKLVNRFA